MMSCRVGIWRKEEVGGHRQERVMGEERIGGRDESIEGVVG